MGAHRLGHAIALGLDPHLFGPHTRTEPVSERIDQLRYDLRHLDDLHALGVGVTHLELEQELDRLLDGPLLRDVTIVYDEQRLNDVQRRQDSRSIASARLPPWSRSARHPTGVSQASWSPLSTRSTGSWRRAGRGNRN